MVEACEDKARAHSTNFISASPFAAHRARPGKTWRLALVLCNSEREPVGLFAVDIRSQPQCAVDLAGSG